MPSRRGTIAAILSAVSILLIVAAIAVAEDQEREQARAFKEAMKSSEEGDRLKAVAEYSALPGDSIGKELRKIVAGDRSDRVRAAAARAIGSRGDRHDLPFLLSSLRSLKKRPVALAGAIDAIGDFREPKTAEAVYDAGRLWLKKHKYPALASIRALARIPSAESVELLFKMYDLTYARAGYGPGGESGAIDGSMPTGSGLTSDDTQSALADYRPHVVAALQNLTGEILTDLDNWKEWWEANQRTFDPASVKVDPNRQLQLTDSAFSFQIKRPDSDWKWMEQPREGFLRTAVLTDDGEITAYLDLLAYSTLERGPADIATLAAQEKERLQKELTNLKDPKFDEAVKIDGVDGIRHSVAGLEGFEPVGVRVTFLKRGKFIYVLRFALTGNAHRGTLNSVEEFEQSFTFL